jgi:hypothetical protein
VSEHPGTKLIISTASILIIADDMVGGLESKYKTKRSNCVAVSIKKI